MPENTDVNQNLDQVQDLGNEQSSDVEQVQTTEEVNEQVEQTDSPENEVIDADKEQAARDYEKEYHNISQALKIEREKAREAETLRRENELLRQNQEIYQRSLQPQQQTPQEDPEILQAKQIAKEKLGMVDKDDVNRLIQENLQSQKEEIQKEKAINEIRLQEQQLKQKLSGRNMPAESAGDLVTWFERTYGVQLGYQNVTPNLLENIYNAKHADANNQYYAANKPSPAPMARTSAPSTGKNISTDDFFNLPADKTDEYFRNLQPK